MKIINQVYATTNYEVFKYKPDNRDIGENAKLREEIKANGILVPVMINEKYEVIDGQHRIEEGKKQGLEIPFIILEGAGKKEIISINTTSKQWMLMDYIKSYASEGIEEYETLLSLERSYDVLPGTLSSLAFNTTDSGRPTNKVKNKQLKFVDYDYLVEFLEFYQEILDRTPLESSSSLTFSLYSVYRLEKFNPERLFDKSGLIHDNLRGVTQQGATTKIILDAYNQRLRAGSDNEIKHHQNAKGSIEFFEKIKPRLEGLEGSSKQIYRI